MKDKIRAFLFPVTDARPIAALRIILGVMMMIETFQIWDSIEDLYGPYGFLEASLMNAISGMSAPSFAVLFEAQGWDYSNFLTIVFWIRWFVLVTFTIGLFTRTSTIFLWLMQSFIMFSGTLSSYGIDRYFHNFLFLLVFMPAGQCISVDAWLSKKKEIASSTTGFALRVLQFMLLITYFNAGVAKIFGTEWWDGNAIWRVLHLPEFSHASFYWMAQVPWFPRLMGWGTLLIETFYVVGVWFPVIGPLWTLGIISMHIGIAGLMGLVNFGITLALVNAALFFIGGARASLRNHESPRRREAP